MAENIIFSVGIANSPNKKIRKLLISKIYPTNFFDNSLILNNEFIRLLNSGNKTGICKKKPQITKFALQNIKGATVFVTSLIFYEEINNKKDVYCPHAIFLISKFNSFYFFEVFAKLIYVCSMDSAFPKPEKVVDFLVNKLPKPSSLPCTYEISCFDTFKPITLHLPSAWTPPVFHPSTDVLFNWFDSTIFAFLIAALLCEKRILIISENSTDLTEVMETMLSCIFPLKWQHLFMTSASKKFIVDLKEYKGPYFVGMEKSRFNKFNPDVDFPGAIVYETQMETLYECNSDKFFVPHNFTQKIARWYRKALRCFPSKKSNFKLFQLVLQTIFVHPLSLKQQNRPNDAQIKQFYRKIKSTEIFKNFVQSNGLEAPEKLSQNPKTLNEAKNALEKNYKFAFEEITQVISERDEKAFPLKDIPEKFDDKDIFKNTDLKERLEDFDKNLQQPARIGINEIMPEKVYSRHHLTEPALSFLKRYYGPIPKISVEGDEAARKVSADDETDDLSSLEDDSLFSQHSGVSSSEHSDLSEESPKKDNAKSDQILSDLLDLDTDENLCKDFETVNNSFFKMNGKYAKKMVSAANATNSKLDGCGNHPIKSDFTATAKNLKDHLDSAKTGSL